MALSDDLPPNYSTIEFTWRQLGADARLPNRLIKDMTIDAEAMLCDEMAYRFRCLLPAQPLKPAIFMHPRDWWEAFKERWFPKWALRRWPVVQTVHEWSGEDIYPEYRDQIRARMGVPYRMICLDSRPVWGERYFRVEAS